LGGVYKAFLCIAKESFFSILAFESRAFIACMKKKTFHDVEGFVIRIGLFSMIPLGGVHKANLRHLSVSAFIIFELSQAIACPAPK
jgi:hypothetical protein